MLLVCSEACLLISFPTAVLTSSVSVFLLDSTELAFFPVVDVIELLGSVFRVFRAPARLLSSQATCRILVK